MTGRAAPPPAQSPAPPTDERTSASQNPASHPSTRESSDDSAGYAPDVAAPDLAAALGQWRRWLTTEKQYADHTVRAYCSDCRKFLSFLMAYRGCQPSLATLAGLSLTDFRAYLARQAGSGLGAASRARGLSGIRSLFFYFDRRGILHNPAVAALTTPRHKPPLPRPLTVADALETIDQAPCLSRIAWIGQRDVALLSLLYGAGLRLGEALALDCRAFSGSDNLVVDGKGGRQRVVPLLQTIARRVDVYLHARPFARTPESPLFVGLRGGRLNPGVAERQVRRLREVLSLPDSVTPHAMRHSFASHLLASGGDLRTIQDLLGHASLSTTQRYTDVDDARLLELHAATHPRGGAKRRGEPGK